MSKGVVVSEEELYEIAEQVIHDFLLSHEDDIAHERGDFGTLQLPFLLSIGRPAAPAVVH